MAKLGDFFKKALGNKVVLSSTIISAITFAGGLLGFVLHLLVSTKIGEKQYGIVSPLLSLLTVINLPAAVMQVVISKDVSVMVHEGSFGLLRGYFKRVFIIILSFTALVMAGLFLALPLLKSNLHIDDTLSFIVVFALCFLALLTIPFNSMVQARERFGIYSVNNIMTILLRLGVTIFIVYMTGNYFGMLWGLVAAYSFTLVFFVADFLLFPQFMKAGDGKKAKDPHGFLDLKRLAKSSFYVLLSVGAFMLIKEIDTILVRGFLPSRSGIYGSVTLLGKASFYISQAMAFVLLPLMAKDKRNIHRSSRNGLVFLLLVLCAYALALTLFSGFISVYLFKGQFPGMENFLGLFAFMYIPFAVINFLVNYYVVSENIFYSIAIFTGAVLETAGLVLFHSDLYQVCFAVGAVGYLVMGVLILDSVFLQKGKVGQGTPQKTGKAVRRGS